MSFNVKGKIKNLIGQNRITSIKSYPAILVNYFEDMIAFYRHSTVFFQDTTNKLECQIILDYHSVEKGLLFENTKPRFAKDRILNLHKKLFLDEIVSLVHQSQIRVAYNVMCKYYELHSDMNEDISDYFTQAQYENYKSILSTDYDSKFQGAISLKKTEFYNNIGSDFYDFSHSRKSVRKYTGEIVESKAIENAVNLALNTPSVCNRQASKVYLVNENEKVKDILKIQGGLSGYTEDINQLLILTTDRNYFYTVGERNQFYIDGGMFLMNLLYALHYYKIAACPANWGKTIKEEKRIYDVISIPKSEKIICIIPIGIATPEFRVTLSQRRELSEVLVNV